MPVFLYFYAKMAVFWGFCGFLMLLRGRFCVSRVDYVWFVLKRCCDWAVVECCKRCDVGLVNMHNVFYLGRLLMCV